MTAMERCPGMEMDRTHRITVVSLEHKTSVYKGPGTEERPVRTKVFIKESPDGIHMFEKDGNSLQNKLNNTVNRPGATVDLIGKVDTLPGNRTEFDGEMLSATTARITMKGRSTYLQSVNNGHQGLISNLTRTEVPVVMGV